MVFLLKNICRCSKLCLENAAYYSRIYYSSNTSLTESSSTQLPISSLVTKILKVAIIGEPNAGKSTLINEMVGRKVFAMSRKVHTTRCRARAVMIEDNTQIVFLDTPGLVTASEAVKHHLDYTYMAEGEEAVKEADIVGIIHDVSNNYTRNQLSSKVLRLLHLYPEKETFLILNKIDMIPSKRKLLDCVDILTKKNLKNVFHNVPQIIGRLTERKIRTLIKDERGWPYFSDVFMVSAIDGNGVGDIKMYLLERANPGKWLFPITVVTDQNPVTLLENCVVSKLLDYLPKQVPYILKVNTEYFNRERDDSITAVVLIGCPKPRIKRLVMGHGGRKIKNISKDVEQELRGFFLADVRLKIVIVDVVKAEPQIGYEPVRDLTSSSVAEAA